MIRPVRFVEQVARCSECGSEYVQPQIDEVRKVGNDEFDAYYQAIDQEIEGRPDHKELGANMYVTYSAGRCLCCFKRQVLLWSIRDLEAGRPAVGGGMRE